MSQQHHGSWNVPGWFYVAIIPFAPLLIIIAAFVCLVMSFAFGSEAPETADDRHAGDAGEE
jgi:uncharacterized membrane protein YhdT